MLHYRIHGALRADALVLNFPQILNCIKFYIHHSLDFIFNYQYLGNLWGKGIIQNREKNRTD